MKRIFHMNNFMDSDEPMEIDDENQMIEDRYEMLFIPIIKDQISIKNKYILNYVPNYYIKICLHYSDYIELFKNETTKEFEKRIMKLQRFYHLKEMTDEIHNNRKSLKLCIIVFYEDGDIHEFWVNINKFDFGCKDISRLIYCFVIKNHHNNKTITGIIGEVFLKDLNDWTLKEKENILLQPLTKFI